MKTEHELLKEICDMIWYKSSFDYIEEWSYEAYEDWVSWYNTYDKWTWKSFKVDVREIIFTEEFINNLAIYLFELYEEDMIKRDNAIFMIMKNLDNPVKYLSDLLWIESQE